MKPKLLDRVLNHRFLKHIEEHGRQLSQLTQNCQTAIEAARISLAVVADDEPDGRYGSAGSTKT